MTLERIARWIIGFFLVLLAVAGIALGYTYYSSNARLDRRWTFPADVVAVPTDSLSIAYGGHVAALQGCDGCHGPDLAGRLFMDAPGVVRLYARNLTPGAGGAGLDGDGNGRRGAGQDNRADLELLRWTGVFDAMDRGGAGGKRVTSG